MEKFDLLNSNGVYYIEKSGMKLALGYRDQISSFGDDYYSVQINNKPIIKSEKSGIDRIIESVGSINGMELPPNMGDMLRDLFKNPNRLKDIMGQMGLNIPVNESDLYNIDKKSDETLKAVLLDYSKRAGIKFNAVLGDDVLKKFIVLIEFEEGKIMFFSDKSEVGSVVGTSYHIVNLENCYSLDCISVIEIEGIKLKSIYGFSGKYLYLGKKLYDEIILRYNEMPESKIDNDYLHVFGAVNDTLFKLSVKGNYIDDFVWVGKLPTMDILSKLSETGGNLEGFNFDTLSYIPLNFFKKGVLIDKINRKFGYKK